MIEIIISENGDDDGWPLSILIHFVAAQAESTRGVSPLTSASVISPESEVARRLGLIGDRVSLQDCSGFSCSLDLLILLNYQKLKQVHAHYSK